MNVGLVYTYASVFQMMRGSVVIFTGLISYFVFKRRLGTHKILGMCLVLGGLACVGSASVLSSNDSSSAPNPLLGALLVVAAQIVVSVQMVVEEKAISKYNVPALLVPGFEGLFGLTMMIILLIIFYYLPHLNGLTNDDAGDHFENTLDAFEQIKTSYVITLGLSGYVCSIAFFNYFGASVTKHMDATTRMVLDNVRTIVIWAADLILQWEQFQFMQVIGFALLLLGTAFYNEILPVPIAYFDYRLQSDYSKLQPNANGEDNGGDGGVLPDTNNNIQTNNMVADEENNQMSHSHSNGKMKKSNSQLKEPFLGANTGSTV